MELLGILLLIILAAWNVANLIRIKALERQLGMLVLMKANQDDANSLPGNVSATSTRYGLLEGNSEPVQEGVRGSGQPGNSQPES